MLGTAGDLTDEVVDVCVVGGGAAGLTLAAELAGGPLSVLVLEAGGPKRTQASQAFYRGEVEDPRVHPAPDHYRVRALGGASRIWGGRCLPYDRIDFEHRPWAPGPGWPLSYETVAAYYPRAQEAAEAGPFDYAADRELVPGLDGEVLRTTLERFSRPTNFWTRFGRELTASANVRVAMNAPVSSVRLAPDGRSVDHLELRLPGGALRKVRARNYVLALGGLETTRLLLASADVTAEGVGGRSGWLGRGYMCHVAATIGVIALTGAPSAIGFDYLRDAQGVYLRRRLWVAPEEQRRRRLLNLAFRLHIPDPADPAHGDPVLSAMYLAKYATRYEYSRAFREAPVTGRTYARHVGNIARRPVRIGRFAADWVRKRYLSPRKIPSVTLFSPNGRYALEFHAEQSVNRDSRLTLTEERDGHGVRRLKIDWRVAPLDIETVRSSYRLLDAELQRTGTGRLEWDEEAVEPEVMKAGAYGGHHIGATRMSATPADGVVDPDLRVHGIENLYVASASALPTSSQANPTLTLLALTIRLADRLQGRRDA